MRLRWLCTIVLLCASILAAVPAQAATIPVSPDQPTKIVPDSATYQEIKALQGYTTQTDLSRVSPDDQAVIIGLTKGIGGGDSEPVVEILNIQDGSVTPIKFTNGIQPLLTTIAWINSQVAFYLSISPDQDSFEAVFINRNTGEVATEPVDLPGFPVSLSPNGTQLLIANSPDTQAGLLSAKKPLKSPFDQEIKRGFDQPNTLNGIFSPLNPFGPISEQNGFSDSTMHLNSATVNLSIINLTSGKTLKLYSLPTNSTFSSISWSPDSTRLALVRQRVVDLSHDGQTLLDVATQEALGNYTPDKDPIRLGNVVDTVDLSAGKVNVALAKATDLSSDFMTLASWSPDNGTLVMQLAVPGHLKGRANPVYLYPESTYLGFFSPFDGKLLSTYKNDAINDPTQAAPVFVSPTEVLINAVNGTNISAYYYSLATGEFRQLPTGDGVAVFIPTHHSKQIVFELSSFTQAPEMFRLNWDGTDLTQLTHSNDTLTQKGKVRVDPVSYTLSNGQVRTGYILQSASATGLPSHQPLVVWQEGGPSGPFLNHWGTNVENPFNLLPNFGYAILFVPLEGREGFGPARYNALADDQNFGKIDIDEMAQIVQQSIKRGYTDAGKVGITGCSYGGYFTSESITKYPNLYSAANTQCTLLDLYNEWQFGYTAYISYLMGQTPMQNPARYTESSPLYNTAGVKVPTLIFDGTEDFLPVELSVNFQDQLQTNGAAVNALIFDYEGHGLTLGHDQLIAAQSQLMWFQKYLPLNNATS